MKAAPAIKASLEESIWANGSGRLQLKSLLVPVDFSECSLKALDYANFLAKSSGAGIELLNVLEPAKVPHGLKLPQVDWEALKVRSTQANLKQLADARIEELVPVRTEVRLGKSYREICEAAARHDQDLIIIGTHGRTGLKHLFLGSTAERVVRFAPCSVLVVRGTDPAAGLGRPARILVPVDFSKDSRLAVQAAAAIAREFGAALAIAYVLPPHYAVGEYDSFDYAMLEAGLRRCAEKELAMIAREISKQNVPVRTQVRRGCPATEIAAAAKQLKAGLIVIATHGHTGFEHAMLGSTTEQVIRHAACPVLVFRAQRQPNIIPKSNCE